MRITLMSKIQSWDDICKDYPSMNVGLTNVRWGINEATVEAGEVVCSEKDTPYGEMVDMALRGLIIMDHTAPDDVLPFGMLGYATA